MTLGLFFTILGIHLAAAISPGPSFLVSVRTAASEGFGTAAALALGFGIGAALWACAAMAGLALLFELVPALFTGLKLVGGLILLWIALQIWRHARDPMEVTGAQPRSALAAVRLGFVTFIANPKPAVFFGAVFVGLVPVETPLEWRAAIVAGIFLNETLWYIVTARLFSLPRARAAYLRVKAWIDRAFGLALAGLGLKIAFT
ncbi:LysE family translocator [Pseudoroseicyclus tamaricis]|uniref:LysE family transporter n=1 Tax=Pseudoroseicyclus tamaricis TaxID=2705421 RepID=A0A6B2JHZ7_9RHOB|nr:LysE family transporter [Pseudoroseicyclus tamaricis]NDV00971.1 LysE family transporter [Pseudoroseicyclus tamaricis]